LRKKSGRFVGLPVLILVGALAPAARAGMTQTFTETVGPKALDFPAPQFISIPQFDPSKGTLDFVTVRITASYDAQILVQNVGDGAANVTVMATETVTVTPPAFIFPMAIENKELLPATTIMLQPTESHLFSYQPGNPREVELANLFFNELDLVFDMFTGDGNLPDFDVFGFGMYFLSSSGSSELDIDGYLAASVEVEVVYHFIPEPATGGLLALGVLCLRRRCRRGRSSSSDAAPAVIDPARA